MQYKKISFLLVIIGVCVSISSVCAQDAKQTPKSGPPEYLTIVVKSVKDTPHPDEEKTYTLVDVEAVVRIKEVFHTATQLEKTDKITISYEHRFYHAKKFESRYGSAASKRMPRTNAVLRKGQEYKARLKKADDGNYYTPFLKRGCFHPTKEQEEKGAK